MPFNHTKYTNTTLVGSGGSTPLITTEPQLPSPHSDAYAEKGFIISFYHMITGKELRFKAFLTALNETYTPDYASEQVFGRADPIHTFRGTTRDISLAFKIPAASMSEAYENLAKTQTLIQMQYPAYIDVQNALTIAQAPLIRIKVMNIIRAADKGSKQATGAVSPQTLYDSYESEDNVEFGLLGVISSLTVAHQLANDDIGVLEKSNNTVLPKYIDVNISFKPLHEHTNGWQKNESTGLFEFDEQAFPYGAAEYGNAGQTQVLQLPTMNIQGTPPATSNLPAQPTQAQIDSAIANLYATTTSQMTIYPSTPTNIGGTTFGSTAVGNYVAGNNSGNK